MISCHRCGMTSQNPNDEREGYCGNCHLYLCRVRLGLLGYWIILHPTDDQLAWTGMQWSGNWRGVPTDKYQVCNFPTEQEAREACREYGLEPE